MLSFTARIQQEFAKLEQSEPTPFERSWSLSVAASMP